MKKLISAPSVDGRGDWRVRVTVAPFGGPHVKLQRKQWFWWQTVDSMSPYSATDSLSVEELVVRASEEMIQRVKNTYAADRDLYGFLTDKTPKKLHWKDA